MKFTPEQFTPTEWDTAAQKAKFANQFVKFVSGGFQIKHFPKWFYKRLSNTFGHIAHYNLAGFYSTFFDNTEGKLRFISMCLSGGGYGGPEYTYCDVERALKKWMRRSDIEKVLSEQDEKEQRAVRDRLFRNMLKVSMLEDGVCDVLDIVRSLCVEQVAQQTDPKAQERWGRAAAELQKTSQTLSAGAEGETKWKVWMEGFKAQGNSSPAKFCGTFPGETFADACSAWADTTNYREDFDPERRTFWGCRLFDNETDARKAFG